MFELGLCCYATQLRILDGDEYQGDEGCCKDCHCDVKHEVDLDKVCALGYLTNEGTNEHRSQRASQ